MTNWRSSRLKLNNTRPSQNIILISSSRRIWRPKICVLLFIDTTTKQTNPILLWKKKCKSIEVTHGLLVEARSIL